MKFSGDTIVAPRLLSSRATYPPAKPPPITSVPPAALRISSSPVDTGVARQQSFVYEVATQRRVVVVEAREELVDVGLHVVDARFKAAGEVLEHDATLRGAHRQSAQAP